MLVKFLFLLLHHEKLDNDYFFFCNELKEK